MKKVKFIIGSIIGYSAIIGLGYFIYTTSRDWYGVWVSGLITAGAYVGCVVVAYVGSIPGFGAIPIKISVDPSDPMFHVNNCVRGRVHK